ncbi:formyltetrahydrofolate deformylase [Merismopedia glauca]|uniref:Formyltetrahydrofolate deformylase n=1 Tax=Merismopedia glauca CCAP 1448/3 TaxID=1296344 RepID=A0A2T1BXF8_9CYAN|nr:formyltetrahydrofolate deformylase [Merismopedia glauca]PSB00597.1 formyltetrahydrofolate deformylase [Merismopedia glauca CCAP 1448/3]
MKTLTATLLISCLDRRGIVAKIANFVYDHGGNIVYDDQYTDFSAGLYFNRIEWELDGFTIPRDSIKEAFAEVAAPLEAQWQLHFSDTVPRIAIFVSRQEHCLLDLLWRHKEQEFNAQIPLIISNHPDLEKTAVQFNIDYYHINITKENKLAQEAKELEILQKYQIDLIILAKYMQVLSDRFIDQYPQKLINIHHSFLPAFIGAYPYHQAYQRGVKIIGATSHYVSSELDAGPIIEQDVARVTHRDTVDDLIRKGRDLERIVLARGVRLHLQNRVLAYGNRTVIFE